MGRGIDTTLDWPAVRKLSSGSWLVDTGARLKVRQRKRFDLKKEADEFASDLRKGFSFDGKRALSEQQKNEYRLAVSTLGDQYKKVSLVDVVNFYLKMQGVSAISKLVREAVPLFINSRRKKSVRYVKQLEFVLGEFADLFGNRKPAEITKQELDQFISGKRLNKRNPTKEIAQTTRHNLHRAVCAFFTYCWKEKWVLENPMDYVNSPDPARLSPKILTIDQAKKLLDFVEEKHTDMLGFFALSLFCGIRVQELCRMTIQDLALDSHDAKYYAIIRPEVAKIGRPRNVNIPYNCFTWLNSWLTNARIPISRNHHTKRKLEDTDRIVPVSAASVFYRTKLIAKESGIVLPQNVLRHSFASYFFETTHDAEQTRARLGHETDDILFKHYAQLVGRARHPIEYFKIIPNSVNWDGIESDLGVRKKPEILRANTTDTFRLLNLL